MGQFVSIRAFLSTLSLRRATLTSVVSSTGTTDFYPRSPCGERRLNLPSKPIDKNISIHALLAESDEFRKLLYPGSTNFYPRSPCGERPKFLMIRQERQNISIHALLAESDMSVVFLLLGAGVFLSTLSLRRATPSSTVIVIFFKNFYPRSPCGERP